MHAHATALDRRPSADQPNRNPSASPERGKDFTDLLATLIRRGPPQAQPETDGAVESAPPGRALGHNADGSRGRGPEQRRVTLPEPAAFDTPPGRLDRELRPNDGNGPRPMRPDHGCERACDGPAHTPPMDDPAPTRPGHQCGSTTGDSSSSSGETDELAPPEATAVPAEPPASVPPPVLLEAAAAPHALTAYGQAPISTTVGADAPADPNATSLAAPAVTSLGAQFRDGGFAAGASTDDLVSLTYAAAPAVALEALNAMDGPAAPATPPASGRGADGALSELAPPISQPEHSLTPDRAIAKSAGEGAATVDVALAGDASNPSAKPAAANLEALERLLVTNSAPLDHDDERAVAAAAPSERADHADEAELKPQAIAAAHRTAVPHAQADGPAQRNPGSIPAQIAQPIIRAARNGTDRIEIHLSPAELGRVDVKLDIAPDGRIQAVFSVDRPQTADLLQRDVRELARALQESGLRADMGNLSFNLRNQNQNHSPHQMANFAEGRMTAPAGVEAERTVAYRPMILSDDQIDFRV